MAQILKDDQNLDEKGYRFNVAIVLCNPKGEIFWGRRSKEKFWQLPQGGIKKGEAPKSAMYRELQEELGLYPEDVKIMQRTKCWLYYDFPDSINEGYRGQKQLYFLLYLEASEHKINIRQQVDKEFDAWRWGSYWEIIQEVVPFKREVYILALKEFESTMQKKFPWTHT